MRLPQIGPFGVKDLFTLVNLAGGVVAVHYIFADQPRRAGYAVIAGYLLGDMIDGQVARRTGTANRFGSEFDSITDHFVHVVVPALLFFTAYKRGGHEALGLAVAGLLVATATIRHALFAAERFDFPQAWCGLPRTISGFVAMSFVLSHHVFAVNPARWATGAVVVGTLSVMNLLPIPYMTHRGARGMQTWAKACVLAFVASPVVLYAFDRRDLFDGFFLAMALFTVFGWFPLHPDERRAFYVEYRRWVAALR